MDTQDFFFKKDRIIYDTTGVCSEQYSCANSLWILSVLSFTYRVMSTSLLVARDEDEGMADSTSVHSKQDGTRCAGMVIYPLPDIWPRAPRPTLAL